MVSAGVSQHMSYPDSIPNNHELLECIYHHYIQQHVVYHTRFASRTMGNKEQLFLDNNRIQITADRLTGLSCTCERTCKCHRLVDETGVL